MTLGIAKGTLLGSGSRGIDIFDNFNRADGALIGSTPSGGRGQWTLINGTGSSWEVFSNRARYTGSASDDPIAVVDSKVPDVDISLDCSWGGDAIYFRVVDANNWIRLNTYSYSSTSCSTCYDTRYRIECYDDLEGPCGGIGCGDSSAKSSCGSCPSCSGSCCLQTTCEAFDTCNPHSCNCSTSYYYRAELEKKVAGTLSTIQTWSGTYSDLRVIADLDTVRVYTGGTDRGTYTITDHQNATLHGIGRTYSPRNSSALDNYNAVAL